MSIPARPDLAALGFQLPTERCVIDGKALGALSCTCWSLAYGQSKSTLHRTGQSGCSVRRATHDTVGGTTLPQVKAVSDANGIKTELHVGSNVCTPEYLARQIQSGRGAAVQINTGPLLGTQWQSTAGAINHCVWLNHADGGVVGRPKTVGGYDPAANGRKRSYHVDLTPSNVPWSLMLKAIAALMPWGENDPYRRHLGPGKVYCLIFPDTEPHFHSRYGGRAVESMTHAPARPDRTRAKADKTAVHGRPGTSGSIVGYLKRGELFTAYQQIVWTNGRLWLGNHDGDKWVLAIRLNHVGGAT